MAIALFIFGWLAFVVICRMIMFKWMTPEQTEQHLRDAKERNRKLFDIGGSILKAGLGALNKNK
jgi:hypothetical protein